MTSRRKGVYIEDKYHVRFVRVQGNILLPNLQKYVMVGQGNLGLQTHGWRKGPWTTDEDKLLTEYVSVHGEGRWSLVSRSAGLNRNSKSCRLRWVNYLRPGLKRGLLTPQEESIIIELHALWGNRWSMMARCLPGRTDNEIKNYWRTHFKTKPNPSQSNERPRLGALRRQEQQEQDLQQQPIEVADNRDAQFPSQQCGYQEMDIVFPTSEEHWFPMGLQTGSSSFDCNREEGIWSGLWNFDDLHIQYNQMCVNSNVDKIIPDASWSWSI